MEQQTATEEMRLGPKITPKKAARLLSVSRKSVYRYLRMGILHGTRPNPRGRIQVYEVSVLYALRRGETQV